MEDSRLGDQFGLDELSPAELESQLADGMFEKKDHHREHLALHPFWITKPRQGCVEEVRTMLGKWNARLEAYVVGFDNVSCASSTAALNEDHKWLHVDILATFYLYKPQVGQFLRGVIKKKGNQAAICILFNVFSATVFATDQDELDSWSLGDEIHFKVQSFQNRRKGPVIRAKSWSSFNLELNESTTSISKPKKSKKNKKKEPLLEETWE